MLIWMYPLSSGVPGHETFTQLPRSRETFRIVPRGACPTTTLPVLGPLLMLADADVTVNSVPCAWSHEAPKQSATTTDAARRII
jgi:hypothetical protein